jgi:hypothetical protein
MSDSSAAPDTIAHYRVKLGGVWLHGVALGTAVRARLAADDPIWTRPDVELLASRPLDAWYGPFPRGDAIKLWLEED